jgi:hypothetical protein
MVRYKNRKESEMKVSRSLVATALMALCVTASSQAIEQVWFVATPVTPGAEVTVQGGPGVATVLNCPPPIQRCEWDITTTLLTNVPQTLGYAVDYLRNDADLEVKTFTFNPAVYATTSGPFGQNQGDFLINDAGAFAGAPPAPGLTIPLHTFRLSKDKTAPILPLYTVRAGIGGQEWADLNGNYSQVQFGSNAPIEGSDGSVATLPVITVTNIPEPATFGLLLVGALGLIRRRSR